MSDLDWTAIRAEEERERERIAGLYGANMREAWRQRILAGWAAHEAAGRKPWKAHVTWRWSGRSAYLLAFERDERRMRRELERQGYEVYDLEPWTEPMPDPLTGKVSDLEHEPGRTGCRGDDLEREVGR